MIRIALPCTEYPTSYATVCLLIDTVTCPCLCTASRTLAPNHTVQSALREMHAVLQDRNTIMTWINTAFYMGDLDITPPSKGCVCICKKTHSASQYRSQLDWKGSRNSFSIYNDNNKKTTLISTSLPAFFFALTIFKWISILHTVYPTTKRPGLKLLVSLALPSH